MFFPFFADNNWDGLYWAVTSEAPLFISFLHHVFCPDDNRPSLSSTGGENTGTAMPRLPSCCQQHSPCGRPSPAHLSLSHSHSSCMQASSSQQTSGSQHSHSHVHSHSNTHHFIHHVHHPAPQPPGTLPFQESSCTVERPTALPATCAGVGSSNNSSSSSNTGHYHDQVGSVLLHLTFTGGDVEVFFFYRLKMSLSLGCVTPISQSLFQADPTQLYLCLS